MRKTKMQSGFSLVESMIAVGLLSVASIAFMRISEKQNKDNKSNETSYSSSAILEKVKFVLGTEENCSDTFDGISPNGGTVTALKERINGTFENILPINQKLPSQVEIKSYTLRPSTAGMASNEMLLSIEFSLGAATTRQNETKVIRLVRTVDGGGLVDKCFAYSNSNMFWKRSATTPADVHYDLGNVGIGTSSPAAKLDVGGPIKLGPPGTCNATFRGSLAYDATAKQLIYCNGTLWAPPGISGVFTVHTASCSTSGSVTNTTSMGTQKICILKKVKTDNRGRDDHTRGQCIITRPTATTWNLQAVCREADTVCESNCVN